MTDTPLTADNRRESIDAALAWLTLVRAPRLGSRRLLELLEAGVDLSLLLNNPDTPGIREHLESKTLAWLRAPDTDRLQADLDWLAQPQCHLLPLTDPDYPALLREIPDPPLALFTIGNPAVLPGWQLAMVGSRNPTPGGARTATEFSRFLARAGLTITSGLASGIDTAAHTGALEGGGKTVAVLGTGPDRVYPAANRELAHSIAEHGALVTEFPPGTGPRPSHFPRRNRIISGLSLGTLVVEAAIRSGSLITARLAMEQGREVFAIPGSIHNPLARGCHGLIRDGAKLVETARDIVEELGPLASLALEDPSPETSSETARDTLDPSHCELLERMGYDPITVDELVRDSGLTAEAVSSMLLIMELQGHLVSAPGGRYTRIRSEDRK